MRACDLCKDKVKAEWEIIFYNYQERKYTHIWEVCSECVGKVKSIILEGGDNK